MDTLPNDLTNLVLNYLDVVDHNLLGFNVNKISIDDTVKNNDWKFILYYKKTAKCIEELMEFAIYHENPKLYSELYTFAQRCNKSELNAFRLKYGDRLALIDMYKDKYEGAYKKLVNVTLAEMKGLVRKNDIELIKQKIIDLPVQFRKSFTIELAKTAGVCGNSQAQMILLHYALQYT